MIWLALFGFALVFPFFAGQHVLDMQVKRGQLETSHVRHGLIDAVTKGIKQGLGVGVIGDDRIHIDGDFVFIDFCANAFGDAGIFAKGFSETVDNVAVHFQQAVDIARTDTRDFLQDVVVKGQVAVCFHGCDISHGDHSSLFKRRLPARSHAHSASRCGHSQRSIR